MEFALQGLYAIIGRLIAQPTDLYQFDFVREALKYVQWLALALLAINVLFQLFRSANDHALGEGGTPVARILYNAAKSVALIYLSPWILTDIFIRSNNELLRLIPKFGIDLGYLTHNEHFAEESLFPVDLTVGALIVFLLVTFVLVIGLIILSVLAGFRYAMLVFLLVIGPLLAVSNAGKGEAYQVWVRESVAVTYTQLFHYFMLGLIVNQLAKFTSLWDLLACIGTIAATVAGPAVIKQFLHSSGVGGIIAGAGRFASMRLMARSVVSK